MTTHIDFRVPTLGSCHVSSPIAMSKELGDYAANYVDDATRVAFDIDIPSQGETRTFSASELLEKAGPREHIYFDPKRVHAGIVTCGGLCPGLNDVIYALVQSLWHRYGVEKITGIRYGYQGFLENQELPPLPLTPERVIGIQHHGGTLLGSSRGHGDRTGDILDSIAEMQMNVLFVIGGDGSQRGALAIAEEAERRGYKLSVIGVPKTIDNDLSFVEKSFGFNTAVSEAVKVVSAAHVEAYNAINGIGLVKLMGRQSGFIAAHAALASGDVNFVLVPEVPFDLAGENGLLHHLEQRIQRRGHAVVVVAEGAGQPLLPRSEERDESGNPKLSDIGLFLKEQIRSHFRGRGIPTSLKYIDPSYIIRGTPASPEDSLYCARLGTNAVHAAMAGKTQTLIGQVHNRLVHVPMRMAVSQRNCVDPESALWGDVVGATGQPALMRG